MISNRDVRIVEAILSNIENTCTPYRTMLEIRSTIYPRSTSWRDGFANGLFGAPLDSSRSASASDYMRGYVVGEYVTDHYDKRDGIFPVTIVRVDGYVAKKHQGGVTVYLHNDAGDSLYIPAIDFNENDPVTVTIIVERKDATK